MTKETKEYNAYDDMSYNSYPYENTAPEKLATLGTLFGVNTPKIETAKVLELGCAVGENIIPHAVHYPKGKYVGIDLSKVQIDTGLKNIKALGLKNIELKHLSIMDINESFGKFDYIICHGVFSWVDDSVREKIMEISSKNLTENGIAFISYNTLPGWNMVRTVRDMMKYHAKDFSDITEGVKQSRALLQFVNEGLEGEDTPYAKMLSEEAKILDKGGEGYLRYEHLEENNKQFYFSEFMQQAAKNNLQYLSDANLSTMYIGNMPPKVADKLKDIQDIVRTEQYMDFITNRRFRMTLLCHNNMKLKRNLDIADIKKFAVSLDIIAEKELNTIDIESNEPLKFFFKGNKENSISVTAPTLKAIFYTLLENKGYPISFKTIVKEANMKLKANSEKQLETDLLQHSMNLVIKNYMQISLNERSKSKIKFDKPEVSALISHQINTLNSDWITNSAHQPVAINFLDKIILKYIDGKNDKKQIIQHLLKEVENGQVVLNKDDKKMEDTALIKKELTAYLDQTIDKFSAHAVLK